MTNSIDKYFTEASKLVDDAIKQSHAVAMDPVSAPTYEKAVATFGTIRHIEPIRDHLINAFLTMEKLRLFAAEAPGTQEPLLVRVEKYLKDHMGNGEYEALMGGLGISILTEGSHIIKAATFLDPTLKARVTEHTRNISSRFFRQGLPKIGEVTSVDPDAVEVTKNKNGTTAASDHAAASEKNGINVVQNAHSALFTTGKVMADDIRTMEALRLALVKVRRYKQAKLEKDQASLAELDKRIAHERATLNGLEAERSETLDDYVVAQRLLAEHWQEIEQAYAERKRVIESNAGLYYVLVRETPLSRTLPDTLDLRPASADDLVPGCPGTPTSLAVELYPFVETLLDIPAADWAALSKLACHLPGRIQLEQMVQKRRQHLEIKARTPANASGGHPTLTAMLLDHNAMIQSIAARPFSVAALRDMQQQVHRIMALQDMLSSPVQALRDPANQLQQRLTAAAGCLLKLLRAIRPSVRIAWAGLADDNRLMVENPERWPNLDKAEGDDFNNIRTLVELVGWWFRQLDSDASGESRTAMRNFIRACLLLAASDDPQQLLHGQIKSLPSFFRPGELLRLDLNREPSPGNLLQLLDDKQQVVATVRVEDHDSNGTLASIATVINPNIDFTTAMRVTGQRR